MRIDRYTLIRNTVLFTKHFLKSSINGFTSKNARKFALSEGVEISNMFYMQWSSLYRALNMNTTSNFLLNYGCVPNFIAFIANTANL